MGKYYSQAYAIQRYAVDLELNWGLKRRDKDRKGSDE